MMKRLRRGPIQPHHFEGDNRSLTPSIWDSSLHDHTRTRPAANESQRPAVDELRLVTPAGLRQLEMRVLDDPKDIAERIENCRHSNSLTDFVHG